MLVMALGRKSAIDHLTFSPDGRSLVAAGEWNADRWATIADGERATRLLTEWNIRHAQQTADRRWVFAGQSRLWRCDLTTREQATPTPWGTMDFAEFDVSPVAPLLLLAARPAGSNRMTQLALCQTDDLTPTGRVWEREFDEMSYFRPQFLTGGDRFVRVEGGWHGDRHTGYRVVTYDTATCERLDTLAPRILVGSNSFLSPDGRWIATPSANAIALCSLEAGGLTVTLKNDSRKHFTGIAFHPSGKFIAVTSNDKTVKLYETATWELSRMFTWDIGKMRSVCFSPDGTLAAAGSEKGQVVVWDVDV